MTDPSIPADLVARLRMAEGVYIPGDQSLILDAITEVEQLRHIITALVEEKREIESAAEAEAHHSRGPRLVPRRDPHLCWRIHPGTGGACQLPDGHDLEDT